MSLTQPWDDDRRLRLRSLIRELYSVVARFNEEFAAEGRKFTPDGHMVGSLGEVLGAYAFDLVLLPASTKTHDAQTKDDPPVPVQIKMTQGSRGVAVYCDPVHLIVLQLRADVVSLIYNGEGSLAMSRCGSKGNNGQRVVSLAALRDLNERAQTKLVQVRDFPDLAWTD